MSIVEESVKFMEEGTIFPTTAVQVYVTLTVTVLPGELLGEHDTATATLAVLSPEAH